MHISNGIKYGLSIGFALAFVLTFIFIGTLNCDVCRSEAIILFLEFLIPLLVIGGFIGWFIDKPRKETQKPGYYGIATIIFFILSILTNIFIIDFWGFSFRFGVPTFFLKFVIMTLVTLSHLGGLCVAIRTIKVTKGTGLKFYRIISIISLFYFIPFSIISLFALLPIIPELFLS